MNDLVTVERRGDIAVVLLQNPPVNALSNRLIAQLALSFAKVNSDASTNGIVIAGAGNCLSGGADIREFCSAAVGTPHVGDLLNPLFQTIENSLKPVVAAIHGTCFGGGLELAMACHYRVAASSARFAQPEVRLGLIPGAGGTQRLPRLVGLPTAVSLCMDGTQLTAYEAVACRLVDEINDDLLATALRLAQQSIGKPIPRTCDRTGFDQSKDQSPAPPITSDDLFAASQARLAVLAASRHSFAEGLRIEALLFNECLFSSQSRALIHLFLSEREAGKLPGYSGNSCTTPRRAVIVGDGLRAAQVATAFADAGSIVQRHDANSPILAALAEADVVVVSQLYFASPEASRVLEIIRGPHTVDSVVAKSLTLVKELGKIGIVTQSRFGSVGRRLADVYFTAFPDQRVYALINEGAKVLDEAAVQRASDLDILAVGALGFPAHLGGPMWYADQLGLPQVLARVRQFAQPSRLLQTLAATKGSFADLHRQQRVAVWTIPMAAQSWAWHVGSHWRK